MMNRCKSTLLLIFPTLPMVTMGSAIDGSTGMVLAFLLACAINLFSYCFTDIITLKICGGGRSSEDAEGAGGGLAALFATHPPPEERVTRLKPMCSLVS